MANFQTKGGSSSRLSPLARPFNINRSNSTLSHLPPYNSNLPATVLPRSFSDFTCEGYSITTAPYYAHFDASSTFQYANHSSITSPNSYNLQYLSWDFQLPVDSKSAFDVMPLNGTMVHNNVSAGNQEERLDHRWKDKDAFVSISYGNTPAEGLKQCGETSENLCGKWIGISEKAKLKSSCSSESNSSAVDVAGSSGTSTVYLPLDLPLLYNLDSDGYDSLSYNNLFTHNPLSVKELDTPFDETSLQILIDKSKDGKKGQPIIDEVMDSLAEIQVTNDSVPRDLTLKFPSAGESEPVENLSEMLGENDSDLDSPCWKGTLASDRNSFGDSGPTNSQLKTSISWKGTLAANQKTFSDSGSVNAHAKTVQELLCSLDPMASHWFSSNDKQSISYNEKERGGVDSLFTLETASSAVNLLSKDHRSAGSSSSDLRNIVGIHCSSDIHIPDQEDAFKNSRHSSLLSFSGMLQPSDVANHYKSNVKHKSGPNVAVSIRGTEDDLHHGSTSIFSPSKSACSSFSCRLGVHSDFTEKHGGATRSFSRPPRLDIQKMVITMNKLSELLVQNCSNGLHYLNEHECDIIKHIVSNLNMCLRNRIGERAFTPDE